MVAKALNNGHLILNLYYTLNIQTHSSQLVSRTIYFILIFNKYKLYCTQAKFYLSTLSFHKIFKEIYDHFIDHYILSGEQYTRSAYQGHSLDVSLFFLKQYFMQNPMFLFKLDYILTVTYINTVFKKCCCVIAKLA